MDYVADYKELKSVFFSSRFIFDWNIGKCHVNNRNPDMFFIKRTAVCYYDQKQSYVPASTN